MKVHLISTNTFPSDQGLRTLSACLKREGHEVKLVFLPLPEDYSIEYPPEVLDRVEGVAKGSGLVGIAAYASTTKRAEQLISRFQPKGIPVVWGGPHPTFFPSECFKHCDIICIGEAEDAIIELAKRLENHEEISQVKNLWVRADGQEYKNDVRPPVHDLDRLAH